MDMKGVGGNFLLRMQQSDSVSWGIIRQLFFDLRIFSHFFPKLPFIFAPEIETKPDS
ncbi:hypothetical protein [Mediterranea massiliensis]|uniref:hypothetical protein n=1 Tax=Mediterranea massiliensis TaxID=1841865 RepID=UPI0025A4951C|nr:hypothetical protein [Mediterranea massiliensis]